MSEADRSMVAKAYAWYTDATEPLGLIRALNWLADIEAQVVATSITANCCSHEDLLEKARAFVRDHPDYLSPNVSPDVAVAHMTDLLDNLHKHEGYE